MIERFRDRKRLLDALLLQKLINGSRHGGFYEGAKNTAAVTTALELNYAVEKIIRPAYAFYSNGFVLKHVVGIDRSDLHAARIGCVRFSLFRRSLSDYLATTRKSRGWFRRPPR